MAAHMANSGDTRPGGRWRMLVWGVAAFLLLLPWIAMRFFPGSGVDWSLSDFVIIGVMLFAACGAYELAVMMARSRIYMFAAGIAIVTGFATVWVNLAVGMVGSENNPYNLLFAGVLVVAIIGALIARLEPAGMVRALNATALAQALVSVIALVAGWDNRGAVFSLLFAAPWIVSAVLFRKVAREQNPAGTAP